jgi:hypothetical protein
MANPSDKGGRGPAGSMAKSLEAGSAVSETAVSGSAAPNVTTPPGADFSDSAPDQFSPTSQTAQTAAGECLVGEYAQASEGGAALVGGGSQSSAGRTSGASRGGASLSAELKDTAQTAADAVRQQAAQFAQDVGHELSKTGEAQKVRGVDAIRRFARAIDSAAAELESQSPTVAHTVHEAARRVDGLSDNLSNRNVTELIDSAARLARSQPALFVGGSVAAGFALARFLKSSARNRPGAGYDPYQR